MYHCGETANTTGRAVYAQLVQPTPEPQLELNCVSEDDAQQDIDPVMEKKGH